MSFERQKRAGRRRFPDACRRHGGARRLCRNLPRPATVPDSAARPRVLSVQRLAKPSRRPL